MGQDDEEGVQDQEKSGEYSYSEPPVPASYWLSKTCLIYLQKMFQIFKNYVLLLVITSTPTTASD